MKHWLYQMKNQLPIDRMKIFGHSFYEWILFVFINFINLIILMTKRINDTKHLSKMNISLLSENQKIILGAYLIYITLYVEYISNLCVPRLVVECTLTL